MWCFPLEVLLLHVGFGCCDQALDVRFHRPKIWWFVWDAKHGTFFFPTNLSYPPTIPPWDGTKYVVFICFIPRWAFIIRVLQSFMYRRFSHLKLPFRLGFSGWFLFGAWDYTNSWPLGGRDLGMGRAACGSETTVFRFPWYQTRLYSLLGNLGRIVASTTLSFDIFCDTWCHTMIFANEAMNWCFAVYLGLTMF